MSAFICGDFHINTIVNAGVMFKAWVNLGQGYGYITEDNAPHVFEVLKRENVRSVNHRYSGNTPSRDGGAFEIVLDVKPLQVLKAINCLEYQSCEHEEWETSLALKICQAIKESAIRELPGYSDAEWEIQRPEGYTAPISLFQLAKQQRAQRGAR